MEVKTADWGIQAKRIVDLDPRGKRRWLGCCHLRNCDVTLVLAWREAIAPFYADGARKEKAKKSLSTSRRRGRSPKTNPAKRTLLQERDRALGGRREERTMKLADQKRSFLSERCSESLKERCDLRPTRGGSLSLNKPREEAETREETAGKRSLRENIKSEM